MASPVSVEEVREDAVADPPAAMDAVADPPAAVDAAENKQEEEKGSCVKKRTREIVMPQPEVDYVLSYEPTPFDPEVLASLEAMGLGLDPDLVAFSAEQDRWMQALQEDYKRQMADKGYVSTMVELRDDEESDDYEDDEEDDYENEEEEHGSNDEAAGSAAPVTSSPQPACPAAQ